MKILKRMEKIICNGKPPTDKQLLELLHLASELNALSGRSNDEVHKAVKSLKAQGEKLNKQENRTERVEIRVTPTGLDKVSKIANKRGLTLSELIRERLPELENA